MTRIEREKHTVELMIRLYCRKAEESRELCEECRELLMYACKRLDACKFECDKPSCKKCPVHCYKPEMRERIRRVMRYAGPRMMLYHPVAAVRHLLE